MTDLTIAITLGDPAGIGPEIIAKAFLQAPEELRGCFVAGDVQIMRQASAIVAGAGTAQPIAHLSSVGQTWALPLGCMGVVQVAALERPLVRGVVSADAGRVAAQCVRWAARAALAGEVAALVTAPLHKEALAVAGLPFPGHTELLQAQAAEFLGKSVSDVPVRMMLANDELRVVLQSIHVSLRDALDAVTYDRLLQTLHISHTALASRLGRAPRIGVAGLNPHAGEGGLFGDEELRIIAPAVAAARSAGMAASGPFAPDTVFMRARTGEFDVVIAMYHDQGLIPVKYLGVDKGVNVTLGLPLVRTSPDHGTAFDIAGSGRADASSLIAAVRMARQLLL